jgi:putative heme-binding domain-containing protein
MQTIGELIREKNLELATTDPVAWAKSRREEAHAEMLEVEGGTWIADLLQLKSKTMQLRTREPRFVPLPPQGPLHPGPLPPQGRAERVRVTPTGDATFYLRRFSPAARRPRLSKVWNSWWSAGCRRAPGAGAGGAPCLLSRRAGARILSRPLFHLLAGVALFALGFGSTRAADTSPAAELASLRVLAGFEVSLFASEADGVLKPIQLRFDPDGRLWVCGSVVYPQLKPGEKPRDRVVVLEDTDGDGRADKSTVFVDDLLMPTGLELGDGGLYVNSGTELLHLRDTNGDGKADQRRVVFRGFGTGDTHQTINSFTWGPSGELLFSQGLHIHSRIETPWGLEELRQAGVWRYWPRQARLDPFWSGAMGAHNPFGNVFDRWGQPFVLAGNGHGIYHLTPAMIRTDHFLEQRWLWNEGRKFGGGDFVENSRWPAANQGELLTGGYLQNTVERFRITDEGGSGFKVTRLAPLIESTNLAFRIVDARFGPDGALYLADWFNPIIGHYQNSFRDPNRDHDHGRIWRVTPQPSVAQGSSKGVKPNFTQRSTAELLAELKSPERWHRQLAKRVLADRPAAEVTPALTRWLAAQTPAAVESELALVEALGVFASHDVFEPNLLDQLAQAKAPEARAYVARVVGQAASQLAGVSDPAGLEAASRTYAARLAQLVVDPHPRVRLEAIVACSYLPSAHAVELAARALDQPRDAALDYAFTQCVHALRPYWQAVHARGELKFDGQANRQTAFAQAVGGANSAQFAVGRLRRMAEVSLDEPTVTQLAEVIAESGGPNELMALLSPASFTLGTNYLAHIHRAALFRAGESSRRRGLSLGETAAAGLKGLLRSADPSVQGMAAWLAGSWRVGSLRGEVEALAAQEALPARQLGSPARADALSGVAAYGDAPAAEFLVALAGSSPDRFARAEAIARLARLNLRRAASLAADFLGTAQPAPAVDELGYAFLRLQGGAGALHDGLKAKPPFAANAARLLVVQGNSGRRDAELAALLAQAAGPTQSSKPATLDDLPALVRATRQSGDPANGARIFARADLACANCHAVDGTPGKIGPNLSALGTAQTLEFILGAILDPQKEVKEGFMAHELSAQDGEVYQGYLRGETAQEITLHNHLTGELVRLNREHVAEQRQLGSLMPAGLADGLTHAELCDLGAYLASLGRR